MISFGKYSKFITALAGAAVLIIGKHAGVDSAVYYDVVAVLTALGVYQVSNEG